MSTKHSPGPWIVAEEHPDGVLDRSVMAGKYYVATVHDTAAHGDCWDADARLVAAAPDLLTALRAMYDTACTNATSTPSRAAFFAARAAIIKATGEQP